MYEVQEILLLQLFCPSKRDRGFDPKGASRLQQIVKTEL